MLIHCFGKFWDPDQVYWGGRGDKGALWGRTKIGKDWVEIDCWNQIGIYALHSNFNTVYVGKIFKQPLGLRLKQHLNDHLSNRWDSFSWFGTKDINKSGTLKAAATKHAEQKNLISTLESFAILLTDPLLNRRKESLPDAKYVLQHKEPVDDQTILLSKLIEKVDCLENKINTIAKLD